MNRALIVIDVQESFCQQPSWAAISSVASGLGYHVTFVTDATATGPIEHRSAPPGRSLEQILADPLTLPVQEVISRTEYALAGRFAAISSVAEVTGSSSPEPAGVRA